MEEQNSSWIRRTNFSHTVCLHLDSSRLASFPLAIQPERNSFLRSRPGMSSSYQRCVSFPNQRSSVPVDSQIQTNPLTNKQRSLSPLPETALSDTFKEARSDRKRFSTPQPRWNDQDKGVMGKSFHKESPETNPSSRAFKTNPIRQLASMKGHEKWKVKKDSAWTKYFDHGGGRVNAVEAADESSVDMSKLFLGLRFAHGAHSRLYHGVYKDEPVAVKIIRAPDDDENGTLAARLKNQYNREVNLLSRLHHPNVIKVISSFFFIVLLRMLSVKYALASLSSAYRNLMMWNDVLLQVDDCLPNWLTVFSKYQL